MRLNGFSGSVRVRRVLLAALALGAPALLSSPAQAGDEQCGNGYCDAWAGENARTCPADCSQAPTAAAARPSSLPPKAPRWSPDQAVPSGFHVVETPYVGLAIAGGSTFGAAWILSSIIGLKNAGNGGATAAIPLVGSFIAARRYQSPPCAGLGCLGAVNDDLTSALLYGFGIIQVAGAAMLVSGLVAHHPTLTPDSGFTITPVPLTGQNGTGLGLVGTF